MLIVLVHKCIHNSYTPSTKAVDHSGWVRLVDRGSPLWMTLWTACSGRVVDELWMGVSHSVNTLTCCNIDADALGTFMGLLWDLSIRTQQQPSKATHHLYSLVGCMLVQLKTVVVSICTALVKQH
jgi:hypothetical protein